jgi:Glycosyltransferase (GlcNAc)
VKTIFVSICSFCDPYLQFTLTSLFSGTSDNTRLHVVVIDQSVDDNRSWIDAQSWASQVQYLQFHPSYSRGVSWARSIAFSYYRGENYLLQIDSHTYFDADWDLTLIDQLAFLQTLTPKAILTAYPPPFEFDESGHPFKTLEPRQTVYWMQPHPDQALHENDLTLTFRAEHVFEADFVVGHHIAGGFIFTAGDFIHDIPYDPYMYFHGEEQNITIRAFTRGWTIYNPLHDNIPLAHLYRVSGTAHPTQHWREDYEQHRVVKREELEALAKKRLCELVFGQRNDQPFGLGHAASLSDFALQSGINYLEQTITPVPPIKIRRQTEAG